MSVSHNAKEAIKTALAMTIAYGIGLQMGWDRPYWAGFAVAFVSLSTVGQSFNKSALRMVGTVMGAVVALTLIAQFSQQRWLFILFLSLWLALCTYMNGGKRHQYFWFVAGFVSIIIAADGGPNAASAFSIAMLRLQQTGLGILTYSLIAIFIWPNSSKKDLEASAKSLIANQQKLFDASLQLLADTEQVGAVKSIRSQEITGLAQVAQVLDAAATDSEEIREVESHWRHYLRATQEFAETLARWRESFNECRSFSLPQLIPGMDAFALELKGRLQMINDMLNGIAPTQECAGIELAIDSSALRGLSHFHRAAALVAQRQMEQLGALSQSMFDSSSAMCRFGDIPGTNDTSPVNAPAPWTPDPDRLLAAGKMMTILWLAFLAIVYIGDFPGGMGFLAMCGPVGMTLVCNPQMPVRLLFAPAAVSISFAGFLYIFVMPQLSSFVGLGSMIFLVTFFICYRYASPQQGLGRALGLAMMVTLISVSNQQTYSFLSVANTALMFPLLFLLITVVSYLPYSPRPERALLRLLARYFRSAEFLLSQPSGGVNSVLTSRRKEFHRQELASLPGKLNAWVAHADPKILGASVQQLPGLVNSLQALSYRLQEMCEVRSLSQSTLLTSELKTDMQVWHDRVIDIMQQLSIDPAYRKRLEKSRLGNLLTGMEKRIEQCLDGKAEHELSNADEQNFYRLLGAYRGTSEALLDFAQQATKIDWTPWHQERFA